jgi:hypothetical protein
MLDSKSSTFIFFHIVWAILLIIPITVNLKAQEVTDEMVGHYRMIYDSTYIWPDGHGGYDYFRNYKSEVALDEEGRSVLSRPATPILDKNDKITIIAYTRLASGDTIYADTSELVTRNLSNDKRWIFVNFKQAEPGAILHFEWSLSSKEANISGKRFLGRTVPVDEAVIVLTVPETWIFNFVLVPVVPTEQNKTIQTSKEGVGQASYSWYTSDISGLSKEEFSPPVERTIPCLYFSLSYDSGWTGSDSTRIDWHYLARLYESQLKSFIKSSSILNPVADSLNKISSNKQELIGLAYKWLEDHFRPIDSDITLTDNVNEAIQRGIGTQAEASAILGSLFEKLGIQASPYLVATSKVGDPIMQLPALFWFNRMLLSSAAGNDTIWFDPLYQLTQVGILPFEDLGATALNLNGQEPIFNSTPMPDYHDNGKAIHLKLDFDSTGSIQGEATEVYSGAMIPEITSFLKGLEPGENTLPWEKKLAKSFPGAKIKRLIIIPPDSIEPVFKIGYSFSTGSIIRPFANRAYIPMDFLGRWIDLPSLPNKLRQFPIELYRPRFELERITLNISSPFEIEFLPANYSENNDVGEIYSVTRGDKNIVTITRGFGLKRSSMPISEYGSLRRFLNKARSEADKRIILKKAD